MRRAPRNSVIAIDLGGTKVAGAIFTPPGKVTGIVHQSLDGRTGRAVAELVCAQVSELLGHAKAAGLCVRAVGVSVPGISYARSGKVWAPNIPGWEAYPLRKALRKIIGRNIPVVIDNDRACCILGETWKGSAKGCRNAVFLTVGTGIGAGVLAEGAVLRGAQDIAGSIGWMALDRPFRPKYQACGCFEHHASGEGLAKRAAELRGGGVRTADRWTASEVFARAQRGDQLARRVLSEAVEFWGMAVANLVSLLNPEKIVFGGGVFGPARQFLDEIYAEARKWAQPVSIERVRLQVSKLGTDAALYGAGCLALKTCPGR